MFTFVTPSFAAGRYSSSFTPRAEGSSFPPAALIRSTSDFGTLDEPCITIGVGGKPAAFTFSRSFSMTSKWSDCCPFEFVSAVAGPDRRRQRIAFGLLDEFDGLDRIGQARMFFIHTDVFLD